MSRVRAVVVGGLAVTLTAMIVAVLSVCVGSQPAFAEDAPEAAPPEGQTYVGTKTCASCHFEQFMSWKKTPHSKAFDLLTDKYKADAKCLKCHTTGYGEPTGFKDAKSSEDLMHVSCENCHGPGSEHAKVCQEYGKKKLTEAEEKVARDSIWLLLPKNVCAGCHTVQGHKQSETPKELQTKK